MKHKYNLGVRDVNKLVSRSEIRQSNETAISILRFRDDYLVVTQPYSDSNILNTDQVGFTRDVTNKRTLTFLGERDTILRVPDKGRLTHSYTT